MALGSLGCVCGFLQDCPLELSIWISQDSGSTSPAGCCHLQAASNFHSISLWGPHTLRLRQSWVKPGLRRLRLAFLVPSVHIPFTYPSPDGGRERAVIFPNTAVCSATLGHFGSFSHLLSQAGITWQSPNSRRHISSPPVVAFETHLSRLEMKGQPPSTPPTLGKVRIRALLRTLPHKVLHHFPLS